VQEAKHGAAMDEAGRVAGRLRPEKKSSSCQDNEIYYVHWRQAKYQKLIPYDPLTNVPILYTASLLRAYHVFATTFEAIKRPSSNGRGFFNSQGMAAPTTSPSLYLKSLQQKRT
jgi:hypothetical protein